MNSPSSYALVTQAAYVENAARPYTNVRRYLGWEKLPDPYRSNLNNATLSVLSQFPPY